MEDIYFPSADGVHSVHAVIWRPAGRPHAILQIIHGMAEYAARYARFAEACAKSGILVCAEDHLGHGLTASANERGHFPVGGAELVLADIRALTLLVSKQFPDVPVIIMGHSMGSFFCRVYLSRFAEGLSGGVVMGTGYKDAFTLAAGSAVAAMLGRLHGADRTSDFVKKLAFGAYNSRIKAPRTAFDWLSADEGNVERYMADELCGFDFTLGGYAGLFEIMKKSCKKSAFAIPEKSFPLFIVSGDEDPVGDYGKGVKKVYDMYVKAGLSPQLELYKGARHEILNDFCGDKVTSDIIAFTEKCADARS